MPIRIALIFCVGIWVLGCSPARPIVRDLTHSDTYSGHVVGVSVYDPARKRYLIQHHADWPFVPASNTKLFSLLAGLVALPDSLPTLRYVIRNDSLIFWGTGNPLLLHPDLPDTSVLGFLRHRPERLFFSAANYEGARLGAGWAWDDYQDDYSAELAPFPMYGNVVRFRPVGVSATSVPAFPADSVRWRASAGSGITRSEIANVFYLPSRQPIRRQDVPFRWSAAQVVRWLSDTLHRPVGLTQTPIPAYTQRLYGTPSDSLYKRMMVVSDNQFAEQVLFMASSELYQGQLQPERVRRKLLDSLLHYPPGSARWADGSGLSRYNLFTPNILVDILSRLHEKISEKRLFAMLPAAGQSGTLRTVVAATNRPYLFAKSGSMTGVYNLSGYLLTKRGRLLYVSVMNNNFTQPVSEVRQATGQLMQRLYETF